MSATETWTVGKLLTWTTDYLKKAGSQSPRLDAEVLLAHARGCQRIELYTAFGEEPTDEAKTGFREMVRRRAEGTPVAYLVGYKEFYADTFEVNPDVLIPRPETEHLVVEALDRATELLNSRAGEAMVLKVADVGTGSGAIALSLAKHQPRCHVTAIDCSEAALAVARRNAARFELDRQRVDFVQSDLLDGCSETTRFDLIVSNPPYVSEAEYEQLDKSVRGFEPRGALVGGPQGSELISRLLAQAPKFLADDGYLIFEFSPMLAGKLDAFVASPWKVVTITKDLAGHARVVTCTVGR